MRGQHSSSQDMNPRRSTLNIDALVIGREKWRRVKRESGHCPLRGGFSGRRSTAWWCVVLRGRGAESQSSGIWSGSVMAYTNLGWQQRGISIISLVGCLIDVLNSLNCGNSGNLPSIVGWRLICRVGSKDGLGFTEK